MVELIKSTYEDTSTPACLAVVVSAQGNTTDLLIDAMDLAAAGDSVVLSASSLDIISFTQFRDLALVPTFDFGPIRQFTLHMINRVLTR